LAWAVQAALTAGRRLLPPEELRTLQALWAAQAELQLRLPAV
jgi:hypothetical protein